MARQAHIRLNQFSEDVRDIREDYERQRWHAERDSLDPEDDADDDDDDDFDSDVEPDSDIEPDDN